MGELDLVCRDAAGTLVGVEVKSRRTARAGGPADGVDRRRVARLRSALVAFQVQRLEPAPALRIDLVIAIPLAGESGWRLVRVPTIDAW
jgi:putative endonuclease